MTEKLTIGLKEAADTVGLSHWTLRKMIAEGKLPAVRVNRRVLIEPAELSRVIAAGRRQGKEQQNG